MIGHFRFPNVATGMIRNMASAHNIPTQTAPLLISPGQLRNILSSGNGSVLDASWFMPNSPRKAYDEYLSKHIPGSQFLDLDAVATPHELGLKHMMPDGRRFADACERFGIEPSSHVVIYDSQGVFSSPRALFMFRAFGHENSSVLAGGLPRWELEGHPVDNLVPQVTSANYPPPALRPDEVQSYEQIVSNSSSNPSQDSTAQVVLDARSYGRFSGTDPEPRPGLPSGHIPHSHSLPFNLFLKTHVSPDSSISYTTFLPPSAILQALVNTVGAEEADKIVKGQRKVITTCGSGMTAGVLWLGLKLLGTEHVGLYDESWTGYAGRSTSRIAKAE